MKITQFSLRGPDIQQVGDILRRYLQKGAILRQDKMVLLASEKRYFRIDGILTAVIVVQEVEPYKHSLTIVIGGGGDFDLGASSHYLQEIIESFSEICQVYDWSFTEIEETNLSHFR